jgi:hypothetical protein
MEIITKEFLRNNPNVIFVFGDNLLRKGKKGAATLRDEPNAYGFITKKYPNNRPESFFTLAEYRSKFHRELGKLEKFIIDHPDKEFLISKLGGGLANKYYIFERIIEPNLREFEKKYNNVRLLF